MPSKKMLAGLSALALLAGCGSAEVAYGEPLVDYTEETAKVVELPDGDRLAVGSRSGHDVTVQWGDGDSWSAPVEVHREESQWTHDIAIRKTGRTVAIVPDYWEEEVLDDDYAPDHSVGIVCREGACSTPQVADRLSSAQLGRDGRLVSFGLDRDRLALWQVDGGWRTAPIEGLPGDERRIHLETSGRFLGVAVVDLGRDCRFDLYESSVGEPRFTRVARSRTVLMPDCFVSSLEVEDDDHAAVFVDALNDRFAFVRGSDGWAVVDSGTPRMEFEDTQGASTLAPTELGFGGIEIVVGSPDRRQIFVQHRRSGGEWSRRTVVAEAPEGLGCGTAEVGSTARLGMAVVGCWPGAPEDGPAPVALVLLTRDGEHWDVGRVEEARLGPEASESTLLAVGSDRSLLATDAAPSLREVRLPIGTWDGITLTSDATRLVRLVGNPDPGARCAPAWTVAPVTAASWPEPRPLRGVRLDRPDPTGTCSAGLWLSGPDQWEVEYAQGDGWGWQGGVRLRGDSLVVLSPVD